MMVKAEAAITHGNLKLTEIQLLREMPEICKTRPNGSQTDSQKSIQIQELKALTLRDKIFQHLLLTLLPSLSFS